MGTTADVAAATKDEGSAGRLWLGWVQAGWHRLVLPTKSTQVVQKAKSHDAGWVPRQARNGGLDAKGARHVVAQGGGMPP